MSKHPGHEQIERRVVAEHIVTQVREKALTRPNCCKQHLVNRGYGFLTARGEFVDGGHCRDGARIRCTNCGTSWVHICDEAGGCSWNEIQRRGKKAQ
jgi:hypothetical protein